MSRDTSFYYAFLVLPANKRRAMISVWDFCRAVDDAVDEVVPESGWQGGLTAEARAEATRQLCTWRTELEAVYAGTPTTVQGAALQPFVRQFRLPRLSFEELIEGVQMDLDFARYPTYEALSEYCRRVASTVGLICLEIFGYRDTSARTYAVTLGRALQLTNIIRDVATDLNRGRIYLPMEDLARFGVGEGDLRAGVVSPEVRSLLAFECDRARELYRRAGAELPAVDRRSLAAAEIMGAIYFEILRRIERNGYDVFTSRVRVPRPRRAAIALGVWARAFI
ncbi:MAG TPA: presqualene diphosphate synthase HpnD [Vicinamibacterales bacterium]|nr:presqualene diphosphate synthase HpnD [Vicinamibacterales bacterium]